MIYAYTNGVAISFKGKRKPCDGFLEFSCDSARPLLKHSSAMINLAATIIAKKAEVEAAGKILADDPVVYHKLVDALEPMEADGIALIC